MASAWVLEAVKADILDRINAVASFLPPALVPETQDGVLQQVTRVYWDTGKVLRGAEIDRYVNNGLNALRVMNKIPKEIKEIVIAKVQASFPPAAPQIAPPVVAPPVVSLQKRKLEWDCKDGRCKRVAPAPAPVLLKPDNKDWFCPLDDSCYIENLDKASEIIEMSDDDEVEFVASVAPSTLTASSAPSTLSVMEPVVRRSPSVDSQATLPLAVSDLRELWGSAPRKDSSSTISEEIQ